MVKPVVFSLAATFFVPLLLLPTATGLGLFFRTSWAGEVSDAVFDSWFDLIRQGREEGPSSPYYVEYLALQSVACSQQAPLGPPCNHSAPTWSHQPLGNETMPYASIFHADVAKIAKYFHLFDKVYVGTLWPDDLNLGNATLMTAAVATQTKVMQEFYEVYGKSLGDKLGWYQTVEGGLNSIAESSASAALWTAFHNEAMEAFNTIKPLQQLWSPNWENRYGTYNATGIAALEAGLETLFCGLKLPLALHYQDYLGQSVTFEFPFFYNYTGAFTCEEDSVPYYKLLKRVQAKCPKLREVKVNMEMFAERLNNGNRGENNGANIVNANPSEIASRMQCYAKHDAPIGACWALPHWYGLMSYANQTVYAPY